MVDFGSEQGLSDFETAVVVGYFEDFKRAKTPLRAEICHLWMDTILKSDCMQQGFCPVRLPGRAASPFSCRLRPAAVRAAGGQKTIDMGAGADTILRIKYRKKISFSNWRSRRLGGLAPGRRPLSTDQNERVSP